MTRSSARSGPRVTIAEPLELRALKSHADFAACVQLQQETWGRNYVDCVPASILKVSQLVGGVSGGAFTEEGRLVGFVYGLTGVRDGQLIHWSHMLAVASDFRDHGVGRRLKEYQRDVVRGLGIEMIYWTFDPLVARNAHLNLNRLGTVVQEYVPDMYGATGSELHAFGTDRFVVSWAVSRSSRGGGPATGGRSAVQSGGVDAKSSAQVQGAGRAALSDWHRAPVANGAGGSNGAAGTAALMRIEIPCDVETMAVEDAQAWRQATRPAFVRLLSDGYSVTGFVSDENAGCYYLLSRDADGPGGTAR